VLAAVGEAIGDPTIPMKLLAGLGDVDSARPNHALWDLSRTVRGDEELTAAFDAGVDEVLDRLGSDESTTWKRFRADWDAFIAEFGSRGPDEWDIHAESWETRPSLPLAALDRVRLQSDEESPHRRHEAIAAQRKQVTDDVRAAVADDAELSGMLEAALVAANMMAYRERTKTTIVKVLHEARMVFRELGRRHAASGNLVEADHVVMLLESELASFTADPASCRETLHDRASDFAGLSELVPPFIIRDGDLPPMSSWERRSTAAVKSRIERGTAITGVSGSPGVVRGTARIVLDAGDPAALGAGEILVAPYTDPSWTPLFMAAAAVVVDVGGQISHAVIVSRELGLPCVVSATGATELIPHGATIEVNGDTGVVTVVDSD
jgi:rifampicin phosphotransferase